jgi:O-antigen/teichoic acid export membrane protein
MKTAFSLGSIFGLGAFLWSVFFLDPTVEKERVYAFFVLYGGVFIFMVFFFLRIFFSGFTNSGRDGRMRIIRQSVLLGILVCGMLALQQWRLLFWWSGSLLVGLVCLIELGFLAFRSRKG